MADVNAAFDHVQKRALRSMTEFESVQAALQSQRIQPDPSSPQSRRRLDARESAARHAEAG
ncbi:hypothetical protein ACTMU2_13920 [Cupriavidus basilensis]